MQKSKFDNFLAEYHRACDVANHIYETGEASITPIDMSREAVNKISESVFKSSESKFLDPAAGLGTFGVALLERLLEYHDFDYILDNMIYLKDIDPNKVTLMQRIGFRNVCRKDFLNE